jgi:glutamyl-Q tRNA(Asp) synthetase
VAGGEPFALRLDMAAALDARPPIAWTETAARSTRPAYGGRPGNGATLGRKDTPTSYHLSVVVDDALRASPMWWRAGPVPGHRPAPPVTDSSRTSGPIYHHHRLILDAEGRKLSKSTCATGLRELRAGGVAPAEILSMIGLG